MAPQISINNAENCFDILQFYLPVEIKTSVHMLTLGSILHLWYFWKIYKITFEQFIIQHLHNLIISILHKLPGILTSINFCSPVTYIVRIYTLIVWRIQQMSCEFGSAKFYLLQLWTATTWCRIQTNHNRTGIVPFTFILHRDGNDYSVNCRKDRNRLAILRFDYSLSFDKIWWKYLDLVTVFSIHKS